MIIKKITDISTDKIDIFHNTMCRDAFIMSKLANLGNVKGCLVTDKCFRERNLNQLLDMYNAKLSICTKESLTRLQGAEFGWIVVDCDLHEADEIFLYSLLRGYGVSFDYSIYFKDDYKIVFCS